MATGDPTTAYRRQQGMAPITQSYDPKLVAMVVKAAKQTGADPVALLATAIQESGARLNGAAGDGGTSFGPFQFHIGGALGNHSRAWASTYDAVLNRAQEFAKGGVHHGKGAAAVQRPADQKLYAQGVDSHEGQAAAILKKFGLGGGATLPLPDGSASTVAAPAAPTLLPMVPVSPGSSSSPQALTGALTPGSFMEAALQTLGVKRHSSVAAGEARQVVQPKTSVEAKLPLPDGTPSTVTNPTMMDVKPAPAGSAGHVFDMKGEKIVKVGGGVKAHESRPLGNWESDNAVDLMVPRGTPIYAPQDGVIGPQIGALNSKNPLLAGLRVHLVTGNNELYYAHLSKLAVKAGQRVKAGQIIGYTGEANGAQHLHLGVKTGDPLVYK